MVNPNISYSAQTRVGSSRVNGVAISLKEFLRVVDTYNIENDGEKIIRHRLRGHPRCESRKKQYFNVIGSQKQKIDRTDEGSVRCLTCVCLPSDELPDGFFQLIQDAQKDANNLRSKCLTIIIQLSSLTIIRWY